MINSPQDLFLLAGAALFSIGLFGVMTQRPVLQRILALNVMGSGVFLAFVTLAARGPDEQADPVPQAMVLTGIVVAVCATALALTLADRIREEQDAGDGKKG